MEIQLRDTFSLSWKLHSSYMLFKWQQVMSIHLFWRRMEIYFQVDTTKSLQVLLLHLNLLHLVRLIIWEELCLVDKDKEIMLVL